MSVSERSRKAGKTLLVVAVILVVVLLLLLPPTQDLLRKFLVDPFSPHYPEEVHMTLERTVILDANGTQVVGYSVHLPRPANVIEGGAPLQVLERIELDPQCDRQRDNGAFDTMIWEGEGLTGMFTVQMTIEVVQARHVWELDEGSVLDRDEVPQYYLDNYLDDQWKIVVNDPVIRSLCEELVGDETNVYLIAKAIYDWIVENIEYPSGPSLGEPRSSVETLQAREGDCDEQSMLFCALARSAGVPAWMQLGAIYDRKNKELGGHGWVQMFMPTADGGHNVTIDPVNEAFLVWVPTLFCEYTDTGDADDLYSAYHHISISFLSSPEGANPICTEEWRVITYEEGEGRASFASTIVRAPS